MHIVQTEKVPFTAFSLYPPCADVQTGRASAHSSGQSLQTRRQNAEVRQGSTVSQGPQSVTYCLLQASIRKNC